MHFATELQSRCEFLIFHNTAVLLGTEQMSDVCFSSFSTWVISWSCCHLSVYVLCNPQWISILRMCTLELMWDFYIYSILPRTLPRPASHQAEENAFFNCFAVVSCYLHLIAPGFYTRRSGPQVSVPLLQATQCHSPLVAIVLHTPKISPFFLVWTVITCSVIQYKDCSASAVIHITFFEVFPALLSLYHCLYFSFCKDEGIRTTPQE